MKRKAVMTALMLAGAIAGARAGLAEEQHHHKKATTHHAGTTNTTTPPNTTVPTPIQNEAREIGTETQGMIQRPAEFFPANARWSDTIAVNTTLYATTTGRCGGAPDAVWAIDLESEGKPVTSWKTNGGPIVGRVAFASDGTLYAATGHRGRVYKIDRAGKSSLLWTAPEPEVFAIATGPSGAVYAATSPDGKIYRIENGTASEYFAPKAKYIWSLAAGRDGALYAGTGEQGKVFRITGPGNGEIWYETGQAHVTGLAVDPQNRVLAGTEPNGILYRISAKDKAFVLYDASLPEIHAIVPMSDGTVYAAALGGSVSKRAQSANQASRSGPGNGTAVTSTVTSITVEAQAAEVKPPDPSKQQTPPLTTAAPPASSLATPVADSTGVEKSALYRINPDNTVETLWSSKEENVYDVLALEKQILFSTDQDGRIYGLAPDRRVTLLTQTNEGETVRLLPSEHSVLAATGNMARIFRMGEGPGASGSYEAPVHDSGTASRWGSLSWRADVPPGAAVQFRTRTGNSTVCPIRLGRPLPASLQKASLT